MDVLVLPHPHPGLNIPQLPTLKWCRPLPLLLLLLLELLLLLVPAWLYARPWQQRPSDPGRMLYMGRTDALLCQLHQLLQPDLLWDHSWGRQEGTWHLSTRLFETTSVSMTPVL